MSNTTPYLNSELHAMFLRCGWTYAHVAGSVEEVGSYDIYTVNVNKTTYLAIYVEQDGVMSHEILPRDPSEVFDNV